MRRRSAAMIVVTVVVGAVAVGSGLTAWAAWSVGTTNGKATVQGDTLPVVAAPDAVLAGDVPRISWKAAKPAQAVGGYAVVRHAEGGATEVCRVAATALTCDDTAVTPGSTVVYTVRAVAGDRWTGAASPYSDLLIVPGGAAGLAAKQVAKPAGPATSGDEEGAADTGSGTDSPVRPSDAADGEGDSGVPSTAPAPAVSSAGPTRAAEPEATEVTPSRTVTSGEEGGAGTSG